MLTDTEYADGGDWGSEKKPLRARDDERSSFSSYSTTVAADDARGDLPLTNRSNPPPETDSHSSPRATTKASTKFSDMDLLLPMSGGGDGDTDYHESDQDWVYDGESLVDGYQGGRNKQHANRDAGSRMGRSADRSMDRSIVDQTNDSGVGGASLNNQSNEEDDGSNSDLLVDELLSSASPMQAAPLLPATASATSATAATAAAGKEEDISSPPSPNIMSVESSTTESTEISSSTVGGEVGEAASASVSAMKVVELKAKCKEMGLPVSGKKAELQQRILSAFGQS